MRLASLLARFRVGITFTAMFGISVPVVATAQIPGGLTPQQRDAVQKELDKQKESEQRKEANRAANGKKNEPKGLATPVNPLLEAQARNRVRDEALTKPQSLPDYRKGTVPRSQAEPRADFDVLPFYGYDFFASARQVIDGRREALRAALGGQESRSKFDASIKTPTRSRMEPKRPATGAALYLPTTEEVEKIQSLSNAQKSELIKRLRQGTLKPTEREAYRAYLYPSTFEPERPPSAEEASAYLNLTDAQKVDLLNKQRNGTLGLEDARLYRMFLYPQTVDIIQSPSLVEDPSETAALEQMSDAQRANIIKRFKEKSLSDDEVRRFRPILKAAGVESDSDAGADAPESLTSRKAPGQRTMGSNGFPLADEEELDFNPRNPRGRRAPDVSAFQQNADPLSLLLQRVIASAPTNYQLAPGDTLILRYSSKTLPTREINLVVDQTGGVTITDVGRIIVRGQTLAQAETNLADRLKGFFNNPVVSLSLKELRTIAVTVTGESYYPGTYQVPAVATAFNVLYASGGPTNDGTLRQIEVQRKGKVAGTLDVYKLLNGGQMNDIQLEAGDIIHIAPRNTRVKLRGEVRREAVFELKDDERLKDAIRYAAGIKPSGVQQRLLVSTLDPGASRIIKDVNLKSDPKAQDLELFDGDTVDVFSVRTTLTNKVTIEGAVDQPGDYALVPGMTVADLVERARGLVSEAYPVSAELYRYNPDNTLALQPISLEKALARDERMNLKLERWDRIKIFTREQVAFTGRREVTVTGAVRSQGIYYRSDNMRIRDLLLTAGGTLPEAFTLRANLLHQRPDGTYQYDFVNIDEALRNTPEHNLLLQDRDVLAIYNKNQAEFAPERTYTIIGEVVSPGTYPRGEGMRLSEALKLAGGLTPKAVERIQIAHARRPVNTMPTFASFVSATKTLDTDPLLEDGDVIVIQGRGDFQDKPQLVRITGAVNRPGPIILKNRNMKLTEIIKEAGGFTEVGFPEGVEFTRKPELLATAGQRQIAEVINDLNDRLSQADYKRQLAISDIDRSRALSNIRSGGGAIALPNMLLPNVGMPGADAEGAAIAAGGAAALFTRDLVTPPRNLTPEDLRPRGNVFVNLVSAMKSPGGEDDIPLQDGDEIVIPERPTTVQVIGAVYDSRGVFYRKEAKLEYYVGQAGGYTADAAIDRAIVIRMGGGLIPIKKLREFRAGDILLVPTKPLASRISAQSTDIGSIIGSISNAALLTLFAYRLLR